MRLTFAKSLAVAIGLAVTVFVFTLAVDSEPQSAEAGATTTASITCTLTASPTTVAPGQSFTYTTVCTITALPTEDAGDPGDWRAFILDSAFPANYTKSGNTCSSSTGATPADASPNATSARCNFNTTETPDVVGGTFTMVTTGSFSAAACGTTPTNSLSGSYRENDGSGEIAAGGGTNTVGVTVNCTPEITCVKTPSASTVNPAQSFTYTTTCTIDALGATPAAFEASIVDTLPTNFTKTGNTCASSVPATPADASPNATTAQCNFSAANTPDVVGGTFSMTTTGSFSAAECGNTVQNTATGTYDDPATTGGAASDTTDNASVTVACAAITCVKTTSDSAVDATQSFTYTTTCTIDSLPANPTNWRSFIIDNLPANFTKTGVNCPSSAGGGVDGAIANPTQGRCNFNTSQTPDVVGGTFELEVTGFFTTDACGDTVLNDASGDYRDDTTEVGPKDTTPTVSVTVHCAEITCVKTTSDPVVDSGESFTYTTTCTIDVLGADPTNHRAIIVDELPANFTKTANTCASSVPATPADGSPDADTARCTFTAAQTPDVVGGTFSMTTTGSFTTAACGTTVQNDAEGNYRDNTSQIGPKHTTDPVSVEVLCGEISCEKTASEEFVVPGQVFTYTTTCTISEAGGPNATAGIEDALPANFVASSVDCFVNGSPSGSSSLVNVPPFTAGCDFNASETPDSSGTFAMTVSGSFTGDECGNVVENTSGPNFYGSDTGSDNDAGPVAVSVVCPTAPDLDFDGEFDPDIDIELPDDDGPFDDGDDDEGADGPRVGTGGTGLDESDLSWQLGILATFIAAGLLGAYVSHRKRLG